SSNKVVGQISRYIGWVRRNLAQQGQRVRGVIIVNKFDKFLDSAVAAYDNLSLKYYKVKFEFSDKSM
ncbi:MAG: DUF91 domain-containing protein, partial [Euryarchaeota archaeon]|nr:DUF91 domain-containing protein [Euryarchaeota archaeon]